MHVGLPFPTSNGRSFQLPDATLVQIVHSDSQAGGETELYTLVRNRRHSNVAFVLGESLRYEPEKDTLTVVPGLATVYPNFMFVVPAGELAQFAAAVADRSLVDSAGFVRRVVVKWGIRRSSPGFWSRFIRSTVTCTT